MDYDDYTESKKENKEESKTQTTEQGVINDSDDLPF